jgi:Fe2+ transport system protein FeoA
MLGQWADRQRQTKETMPPERRRQLDELGFVWDPLEARWEEGFSHLKIYRDREGDCLVPRTHKEEDGFKLGSWVGVQRVNKDKMPPERRQRLDELGFVWSLLEADWEEGFSHLKIYRDRVGDCRVEQRHKENGFALGQWVTVQRVNKHKMSPERRQRLNELGFVWDPHEADWEEGFNHLKIYRDRVGDCLVEQRHKENGFALGQWVSRQRQSKDTLSLKRRQRLDELGFVWDILERDWEEGFNHLRAYKSRENNCNVSKSHKENGFPLGLWVSQQRVSKDSISPERRQRLDEIGFVWDAREAAWEKGFNSLKVYAHRVGDCRVPKTHKEEDGFELGSWVGVQRANKDKMSPERRQRLDELGFVWDPQKADWEEGFSHLKIYRDRVGDCLVPKTHKEEDGFKLGSWVSVQRANRRNISAERKARLDKLGFVWKTR